MRPLLALNALVLTLIAWQLPGQLQEQRLQSCLNSSWSAGLVEKDGHERRYAMLPQRYVGQERVMAHLFMRGCRMQVGMAPIAGLDEHQDWYFTTKFDVHDLEEKLRASIQP